MATATPNIMLKSISGRIGSVVFYVNRGRQCVRAYVIPRNPDTEAQRFVRSCFGDAVRTWQSMTSDEKYAYTRKARNFNMSGYNLFISNHLKTKLTLNKTENTLYQHNALSRASAGRGRPSVSFGRVRAQANNRPSTDGLNLNTTSPSCNLEHSTWNLSPIPSVSASNTLRYGMNTGRIHSPAGDT